MSVLHNVEVPREFETITLFPTSNTVILVIAINSNTTVALNYLENIQAGMFQQMHLDYETFLSWKQKVIHSWGTSKITQEKVSHKHVSIGKGICANNFFSSKVSGCPKIFIGLVCCCCYFSKCALFSLQQSYQCVQDIYLKGGELVEEFQLFEDTNLTISRKE